MPLYSSPVCTLNSMIVVMIPVGVPRSALQRCAYKIRKDSLSGGAK